MNSWDKAVGDTFTEGDRLCEIALPIMTIGVDAKDNGILAKIIVDKYESAPADSPIALYAISKHHYMNYLAETMTEVTDEAKYAVTAELEHEKDKKPDASVLMKEIKHLIQSGKIDSESGTYSK